MIFKLKEVVNGALVISITRETNDPAYVVTEDITAEGFDVHSTGANVEERTAIRVALRNNVAEYVARYLAGKKAVMPRPIGLEVQQVINSNWERKINNVDAFINTPKE